MKMQSKSEENTAVENFKKYLKICTAQPDANYDECVKFLSEMGADLGLPVTVLQVHPGKPVIVISMLGTDPALPSILLHSHMDVVPVEYDMWSFEPFSAETDDYGNIYGRGAQDMKSVGIQYIETIRKYVDEGLVFKRTIHIAFVPDKEIGGVLGIQEWLSTEEFHSMNVGVCLDEGFASESDEFILYYAERTQRAVEIICPGNAGHASLLNRNTAAEKIQYIINRFMNFREYECQRLQNNPKLTFGDVTSVNLTMLQGGVQMNVLPSEFKAIFDVRVALNVNLERFENMLHQWCREAGDDVRLKFMRNNPAFGVTKLDDSNPWWRIFKNECDLMQLKLRPAVYPAAGGAKFLRSLGISVFGFTPINHTPVLAHDHDEYLNENVFLRGIDIYYNIIKALASFDEQGDCTSTTA